MNVPTVNRTAVFVIPRQRYYDWANALDDDGPRIDDLPRADRASVYLIEPLTDPPNQKRALRDHWSWMFEEKLHNWHRLPEDWPSHRTYEMFLEWFEVYLVEPVFDVADMPLWQED